MAQRVDLGAPYGIVDFPDDYTPQQIVADYDELEAKRTRDINRLKLTNARLADINAAREESHIPERIALGVDAGVAAAPIAAGHVLQAAVNSPWIRGATQSQIDAMIHRQPMPEREDANETLPPPAFGSLLPAGFGLNAPTLRYIGKNLVDYGVRRQQAARDEAEQLGGGVSGAIAGSLAETATVSSQTLPFAALGMAPVAAAAGLQSYGLQKEQWKQQIKQRNPEISDEEAYRLADTPAVLSGVITTGLTRVFGGTERLVNRIIDGNLKVTGVKQLLREANLAGATEFPEEGLDQLAQGFIEKAYINPDKPVGEIVNEAVMAGLTGYGLGVGHAGAIQAPLAAASAVEGAVRPAIEQSRVRRESRDESRARITRVIAEREANATSSGGAVVTPPSQEEGVRQEAGGQVYLRGATPSGVEAEAGTPIAGTGWDLLNKQHGKSDNPLASDSLTISSNPDGVFVKKQRADGTLEVVAQLTPEEAQAWNESDQLPNKERRQKQNQVREALAKRLLPTASTAQPPSATPQQTVVQQAIDAAYGIEQTQAGWQEIPASTPTAPIAIPRLQQIVAGVTSQWANAPKVNVVQSVDQLPDNVKARAATVGMNRVAAVADSGQVWLVANNITDEERAKRLLLHESVGHLGVESVFATSQEFTSFMQGVAQRHASTPLGQQIRAIYGNDPITFGKEIVAKLAENPGADPTLWQQVVAAVRNWARRVFKVSISDNDIRVLLQRGRRAVESEQTGTIGRSQYFLESGGRVLRTKNATVVGPASFAITALHGTPHKIPDRFKTEKIGSGEGSQAYGWGLYFAELLEVAETYQRRRTKEDLYIDGIPLDAATTTNQMLNAAGYLKGSGGDLEKAIGRAKELVRAGVDPMTLTVPVLESWRGKKLEFRPGGNLYTVSLLVEPDELLDWDAQYAAQSDHVKYALDMVKPKLFERQIFHPTLLPRTEGRVIYKGLREMMQASEVQWSDIENAIDSSGHKPSEQLEEFVDFQNEPAYETKPGAVREAMHNEYTLTEQRALFAEIERFAPEIAKRIFFGVPQNDKKAASDYLAGIGIKGIKFLDRGSRSRQNVEDVSRIFPDEASAKEYAARGERGGVQKLPNYYTNGDAWQAWSFPKNTYNYVIFNDADIQITHENGQPVPMREAMGGTSFALNDSVEPPGASKEMAPPGLIKMIRRAPGSPGGRKGKRVTARDALNVIARSSPEFGAMASRLLEVGDQEGLSVGLTIDPFAWTSYYEIDQDRIGLNRQQLQTWTIVHEIVHALTIRKIYPISILNIPQLVGRRYLDSLDASVAEPTTTPALKNIIKLYKYSLSAYENTPGVNLISDIVGDPEAVAMYNGAHYGLGDVEEFIAEAFSSREFQKWLDSQPGLTRSKSIWREIVDAIRELLGLPESDESLLQQVLEAGAALASEKRGRVWQWMPRAMGYNNAPGGTSFALNSSSTSVFPNREAVQKATSNPGLTTDAIQEAEALAAAQSGMVTTTMANWLQEPPADKVETKAKKILKPLLDVALMSPVPRPLSSFPEGTTEEKRTRELAGWSQLAHHGFHRDLAQTIASDIAVYQLNLTEAMSKTAATTHLQHKANFLTATFKRLTESMRDYLVNKKQATRGNLQAQWDQRIARAEARVNEHEQSPTAVRHALSAIARTIPDNLLIPTITLEIGSNVDTGPLDTTVFNQPVIDWAVQNGALNTVVSDSVRDWLLSDDGTGQPALISYPELLEDLRALKDILNNEQQVNNDIDAFEAWFKNAATGTGVSAKDFAEKYFKFRTGRDSALRVIAANEKEIDRFDLNLRANVTARDRLASMMSEPGYNESVRQARDAADIVIRSLYDPNKPKDNPIGLIDRDSAAGKWILKGPVSGFDYVVDLHPSSAGETKNVENLAAFAAEARAWARTNATTDPLKADEFNDLAGYIEGHLMSASLNPKQGFTMTRVRIPFTDIRMAIDPFDVITALSGTVGYSFQTVKDVIERIGGRTVQQAFRDAALLDTIMRKVEGVDSNPVYGRAAQTAAVLKALKSHDWDADQIERWNGNVAEPVLASGQNKLSPVYEVGDIIVGSDTTLTSEDVAALSLMKRWGDAMINVAPHSIEDRLSELGITRKALGNGKWTGHRIEAPWTRNFVSNWKAAPTDAAKADLLTGDDEFRNVVLGYLSEYNPEFGKMNPASSDKSPLFELYRRLANTEKQGVDTFRNWSEVIRFLTTEGVRVNLFPDYVTGAKVVSDTLFSEIKGFIDAFDKNVINPQPPTIWGAVPPELVSVISTRNSWTTPRSRLVAPSTFYSYSTATAARQQIHVGGLRSLLNLKLLQSLYETTAALESKKTEMEARMKALESTGLSKRKARSQVKKETKADRKLGDIRYDYGEIITALRAMEQARNNIERYEKQSSDHYEHAGVAATNSFFSSIKASLLSSIQAISTNYWSGALLGPSLAHWQAGQYGRALGDIVVQPALMAKTVMKRIAAMADNNPLMSRLLRTHAPMWDDIAESVIKAAADWRRLEQIAHSSGMVNPYNLGIVLDNMGALKSTAGRFMMDDPNWIADWVNTAMSAPGVRHVAETGKALVPRVFDNAINYMMILNWDREVEMLKKVGWVAFQNRETAAASTGADWKDLSKPENILTPGDLRLKTNKAMEWFRQLFIPLGSLDGVLRDYYERTKTMTPEQRTAEPLLSDDDHAALALQYAAKSNVSVETNRPYSLKGKGSDGVWRNIVGTFMGWGINMMHQLSKGLQTHSKDKQFPAIAQSMIGIATIVVLLAAVGAWNWEFGDAWSKLFYGVSSARIQPGNIQDWTTGLKYLVQAVVNTVPMIGSSVGGLFGVAYTGRGNPFDMTSLSVHIGLAAGIYNTVRRTFQTGDATLPLADFTRQWVPMSKIFLNRVPTIRGLVDQQNAVRAMNASAPPGTEIKWGKRGGGDVKYSPANDEVQRLIAAAYEVAAHGGDPAQVQVALQKATAAYVATGRSPDDAQKALTSALGSKEPIRVLTGREMTPEEEAKWVSRMTKDQKADYDKAVAAWSILSAATGKDFNMVTTKGSGGGGTIPSRAVGLGGGTLRPPGAGLAGQRIGAGIGTRSRRLSVGRRTRSVVGTSRRRLGPRIGGRAVSRRRVGVGSSRRRRYALA